MSATHAFLDTLTMWCLQVVGLAWLVAAAYFAARRPERLGGRVWHFVRTFLPEPWALVLVPVGVALVRVVPHATWEHLRLWNPVAATLGAALVVAGTALMLWARWTLGGMWAGRPLVQQEHELCTAGPYRYMRHPIYTGIVALLVGGVLEAGFGTSLVLLLLGLPFVAWRVRTEERMMIATFGDRYRLYRMRVRALAPIPYRAR